MPRDFNAELREKIMRKDDTGEYIYDPRAVLNYMRVMESPPKPRSKPKPKPKSSSKRTTSPASKVKTAKK